MPANCASASLLAPLGGDALGGEEEGAGGFAAEPRTATTAPAAGPGAAPPSPGTTGRSRPARGGACAPESDALTVASLGALVGVRAAGWLGPGAAGCSPQPEVTTHSAPTSDATAINPQRFLSVRLFM